MQLGDEDILECSFATYLPATLDWTNADGGRPDPERYWSGGSIASTR